MHRRVLIVGFVGGLTPSKRTVVFNNKSPLIYELLKINASRLKAEFVELNQLFSEAEISHRAKIEKLKDEK